MQNPLYDYKRFAVLYVDDEEKSLHYFREAFTEKFTVITAKNSQEAFSILQKEGDHIGVLVTDQRMPGEKGIQLLERVREWNPKIIRILVTAYSDLETATQAVNTGSVYKYITKPWDINFLETTLMRSLEFFIVQRERDMLMQEKISVLHRMVIADRVLSLGVLGSHLNRQLRNALSAVRDFLDIASPEIPVDDVDMNHLRQPNFWREYYRQVHAQLGRLENLLEIATETVDPLEAPADFPDRITLDKFFNALLKPHRETLKRRGAFAEIEILQGSPVVIGDEKKLQKSLSLLLESLISRLPTAQKLTITLRKEEAFVQVDFHDPCQLLDRSTIHAVLSPLRMKNLPHETLAFHLLLCYLVVYHHGGRVMIQSWEDQTQSLIFQLPVDPQEVPPQSIDKGFYERMLFNDSLWERILTEY